MLSIVFNIDVSPGCFSLVVTLVYSHTLVYPHMVHPHMLVYPHMSHHFLVQAKSLWLLWFLHNLLFCMFGLYMCLPITKSRSLVASLFSCLLSNFPIVQTCSSLHIQMWYAKGVDCLVFSNHFSWWASLKMTSLLFSGCLTKKTFRQFLPALHIVLHQAGCLAKQNFRHTVACLSYIYFFIRIQFRAHCICYVPIVRWFSGPIVKPDSIRKSVLGPLRKNWRKVNNK